MKLETTLPERPGFLHVVPMFNLFGLLLMFMLLGPNFVLQSGVSVELPPSRFQMEQFQNALVVTVTGGEPAKLYYERQPVNLETLGRILSEKRGSGGLTASDTVVVRVDAAVSSAAEREVVEQALKAGYRVILAGRPGAGASSVDQPKNTK